MKKTITKSILYMSVFTIWSFLISCIFAVTLFANNPATAQSVRDVVITIEFDNATLLEVFEEIEDKTKFTFLYHKSAVETSPKRINIKEETTTVANILQNIMAQTGLEFNQINGTIAVKLPGYDKQVQTGSITGTVTNQDGEPVPTANVLLVEIGRGAATNLDGEYTIDDVPTGTYTLRVSFIGYQEYTEQVTIEEGQTLTADIVLRSGAIGLEQLVVTGYGVETKSELTGSIATINTDDIENIPVQSAGSLLQGRAAGVQVAATSGQPGAGFTIRVRGTGSINASSRPLYIVDGIPISFSGGSVYIDSSPLNVIDPNNIASIEILKDAAATAIYGAQGGNGVVLITTKQGEPGETQISASVTRGVSQSINNFDFMNTEQWLEYFIRGYSYTYDLNRDQAISRLKSELLTQYGYTEDTPLSEIRYTNWLDLVTRMGNTEKYNLTFSGGNEETLFYLAGGYESVEGQIKNSDFQQFSLSSNLNHQFSSKFSFNLNIELGNSVATGICEDGFSIGCPTSGAIFEPPIAYPYLDNGEYNPNVRFGKANNLALVLNEVDRTSNRFHLLGGISGTYNFTSWLSLKTQFGLDYSNVRDKLFLPPIADPSDGGDINSVIGYNTNFTTSTVLSFSQTFDEEHNFSGLLGGEYRRDLFRQVGTSGIGLPGPIFNVLSATSQAQSAFGLDSEFRTAGYFANLEYNYDQRYYLAFTGRFSGPSRFGSENRWGFFPAVSAAWRISEEEFFTSNIVEELKLRASYGTSGNSLIGRYAARGLYGVSGSYNSITGLSPTQLANPILTWEESTQLNIGLDFGLFNGRFSGSMNVYQKLNEALLLERPLPGDSSFDGVISNVGTVRNLGIEFNFQSINVSTGDFFWSTRFNITLPQNEVIELTEGKNMLYPSSNLPIAVGHSISAIYTERWAGVNPVDGRPMWYNKDGNIIYNPTMDDAVFIGDGQEDLIGGFGNTISYKGLSLDVFFHISLGKRVIPSTAFVFGVAQIGATITNGLEKALTESWQNPGDWVGIPSPQVGSPDFPGTGFYDNRTENAFFNASYIRLKNASLSYSFPISVIESLNISGLQLYVSGFNLVTFTSFPGADPEVSGVFTASSYPVARSINGGIEVQF